MRDSRTPDVVCLACVIIIFLVSERNYYNQVQCAADVYMSIKPCDKRRFEIYFLPPSGAKNSKIRHQHCIIIVKNEVTES